jgi:hypothetical protein
VKHHWDGIVRAGLIVTVLVFNTGLTPAIGQSGQKEQPDSQIDRSRPDSQPLKKYKVSNDYLHTLGLAFGAMEAFPNKCYYDLSISDQLFVQFKSRGFSMPALCLAIISPWVTRDPETGRPLTVVSQGQSSFLVEIPGCFRNGTPFLDCKYNFGTTGGKRQETLDRAIQIDAAVKKLIANGAYTQVCPCANVGWNDSFRKVVMVGQCRVDRATVCMEKMSGGKVRAGSLVLEEEGYSFKDVTGGATDYGGFEISPQLPRGYMYQVSSPEGDDGEPYREIPPGTKISVGPEQ